MRTIVVGLSLAGVVAWPLVAGAQTDASAVEELKRQMLQLQKQMEQLQHKIEKLEAPAAAPAAASQPVMPPSRAQPSSVQQPATLAPSPAVAPAPPESTGQSTTASSWSPSQPITLFGGGANYMNVSFDTIANVGTSTHGQVTELELGDHDPDQRGFSLRNAELALDGAVDPYFKAFANVVFKLDRGNETELELEEAYGLTTSLPWNLQAKAGQFFAEFGRQNTMHPHAWAFVDQPLVMGRLLGGDNLRNVGARVSWLAPTPFYTELMLGVLNGEGGTAFSFRNEENTYGRTPVARDIHGLDDLLYVPRITSSFDLSDTQTIVAGASGAFGPNDSGDDTDTQIYGADVYWKWRPERAPRGFPFVSLQTEAMVRRYEAGADATVGLPAETLHDWGLYSQLLWGFRTRWVAGLRGEFVNGDESAFDAVDPLARDDRTRISPNLTFYPTEFSKLRLQYNLDDAQTLGDEHSVWLQMELLLGAHGAHKF